MSTTRERIGARPPVASVEKVSGTWVSLAARRVAYAAKGGSLWLDGAAGPEGEGARGVSFSDDGASIAYYLKRGDEGVLVVDGAERGAFTGFGMHAPVWSGRRFAFTARRGAEWFVVVDGEPRFGPFTDDQPGSGFGKSRLVWSGERVAYAAVRGEQMRMELDGAPLGGDYALVRDVVFRPGGAPDGGACAYRARRDDAWWIVWDGKELGPFEKCEAPRFDAGGRLFFVTSTDTRARLWIDGVVVEERPAIHELALPSLSSAGAPRYALVVGTEDGERRVVHARGEASAAASVAASDAFTSLLGLVVTPDGLHAAVVAAKEGAEHVLVDGEPVAGGAAGGGAIAHGSLVLGDDAAHVAFLVHDKPASFVQVNDARSEPFDALTSPITLRDGRASFAAEQGDEMFVCALDAPKPLAARAPRTFAATIPPAPALGERPPAPEQRPPAPPSSEAPPARAPAPATPASAPASRPSSEASGDDGASGDDAASGEDAAPKKKKKATRKKAAPKSESADDAGEPAAPAKKKAAKKKAATK